MTETNTSHDVLVLGDRDTFDRADMLAERAAEKGAVIAQTYAFDPGEAAGQDDLTEIEAVVAALSRAIATRTAIWLPFPLQDLCREEHFRRLSLTLQRHGLNLLMGPDLEPCPIEVSGDTVPRCLTSKRSCTSCQTTPEKHIVLARSSATISGFMSPHAPATSQSASFSGCCPDAR